VTASSPGGLPTAFRNLGTASFADFLAAAAPDLLPARLAAAGTIGAGTGEALAPHGTTIVALRYADGVVMAGDRRATMGNVIAQRDIEKVFPADSIACVGIAGSAGIAVELVRLFQVELEHYEKIEGTALSLEGKANRLGTLLRSNLGLAMQGLAAVPMLAGFDADAQRGRIFSYDLTGGRYEEHDYHSIGSGSFFAKSALKKMYDPAAGRSEAVTAAVQALFDAADDDSATGGPDVFRGIFPIVVAVDGEGFVRLADQEVAAAVEGMLEGRRRRPDGPLAEVDA
jgi:proteasome beta subunit